jgi:AcrR family transcriptional regulator
MTAQTVKRRRASRGSGEQLHAEIVAAAKALLAKSSSVDAVSIRAVADAVGVTPPSIYLHFADKNALVDAVVSDVFAELDAAITAAAATVPDDAPFARLKAQGLAYVHFAIEHAEHYRVAAMEPCLVPPNVDDVIRAGAFAHFAETVTACMKAGIFAEGDPVPVALDLWAAAHGIAALMIAKPYLPWGDTDDIANRVLRAAAVGRAVNDMMGGDVDPSEFTSWLSEQKRPSRTRARHT